MIRYIAPPVISRVQNVSTGVKITWGKIAAAPRYRIYRKTGTASTAKWEILGSTTAVTYTDKTAKSGTTYRYMVRCVDSTNKVSTSFYFPAGRIITFVARPALSSATNPRDAQVTAKWAKTTGVTGYQVQCSTVNSFKTVDKTVTVAGDAKTAAAVTGLMRGKTYYVRMRAYKTVSGKNYYSAWSVVKTVNVK